MPTANKRQEPFPQTVTPMMSPSVMPEMARWRGTTVPPDSNPAHRRRATPTMETPSIMITTPQTSAGNIARSRWKTRANPTWTSPVAAISPASNPNPPMRTAVSERGRKIGLATCTARKPDPTRRPGWACNRVIAPVTPSVAINMKRDSSMLPPASWMSRTG